VLFVLALVLVAEDPETIRRRVDTLGTAAPVAFVALMAGLTCAFFPFPVMAAAGGLAFGTAAGTALAVLGGTLGAVAAFAIARRFGAGSVRALAGPRLQGLLAAVQRRGFVAVLYLRIFPGVPRDLANYLCGLTTIPLASYALATLIGIAPRAFAYTALGGSFGDLGSPEAIVAVALLVGMGLLGLALVRRDLGPGRRAS